MLYAADGSSASVTQQDSPAQKQKVARRQGQRQGSAVDRQKVAAAPPSVNVLKGYDLQSPTLGQHPEAPPAHTAHRAEPVHTATQGRVTHAASNGTLPLALSQAPPAEPKAPPQNALVKLAKGGKRDRAAFEGANSQLPATLFCCTLTCTDHSQMHHTEISSPSGSSA